MTPSRHHIGFDTYTSIYSKRALFMGSLLCGIAQSFACSTKTVFSKREGLNSVIKEMTNGLSSNSFD